MDTGAMQGVSRLRVRRASTESVEDMPASRKNDMTPVSRGKGGRE
jgi:hypothetical protein